MINILKIFFPKIRGRTPSVPPLDPRLENDFKYVCTLHSTPYTIEYLMHMENQFSCGSCGQVSKTAKKLQGLKVRSFGIILHKIGHVCPFSGLMFSK